MSSTLRRGFSDEIGSWKIICMRGRILRSASPFRRRQLLTVELHAARRGGQLHDRATGRRLAAARLADEPQGLAFDDVEAHRRHRVDLEAARDRELDDEILDAQQRRRSQGADAQSRSRPSGRLHGECSRGVGTGLAVALERFLAFRRADGEPAPELVAALRAVGERRLLFLAARLDVGAARGELAALRWVHEVRRPARNRRKARVARVRDPRDRGQQRLRVRHLHVAEQHASSAPSRRPGPRT